MRTEQRTKSWFWLTALLALVMFGVPQVMAEPGGSVSAQGDSLFAGIDLTALEPEKLEAVVERSYHRLAELIGRAGEPIEFELSRFQTFTRAELDHVYWLALVDLPEGRVIDVSRENVGLKVTGQGRGTRHQALAYRAVWVDHPPAWRQTEWAADLGRKSAREVLEEASGDSPLLREISAITSYNVRVSYLGEVRLYRAAMLFFNGEDGQRVSFSPVDLIVQGVQLALAEKEPNEPGREAAPEGPIDAMLISAKADQSCIVGTVSKGTQLNKVGVDGHLFGEHRATASLSTDCSCHSDCSQRCDAVVASHSCDESFGAFDACHVLSWDKYTESGYISDATTQGASCAAGFACAKKSCTFCLCVNFSTTVTFIGGSMTVNFNGDPQWTASATLETTCTPCTRTASNPPPPPIGDGDSNPPGGGSSNPPSGGGGSAPLFGQGGGCSPPPMCDPDGNGWVNQYECVSGCSGYWGSTYCYYSCG